jgi:hypothetical protein
MASLDLQRSVCVTAPVIMTGPCTDRWNSPFLDDDEPVISVDTKKKELIGNYHNKGRE